MNRKLFAMFTLVFVLAIFMTACGSKEGEAKNEGGDDTKKEASQTIKVATPGNEKSAPILALYEFADIVEDRTDGELKVEVYPGGQLGSLREQTEQVQTGTVEIAQTDMQTMSAFVDSAAVFSLPYLLPTDEEEFSNLLKNEELLEVYESHMEDQGFHLFGFFEMGYKYVTNTDKPIESPDDFKGMKIRVTPSDVLNEQYKTWGADPVSIEFDELYTSLQTGVVDAQENPIDPFYSMGFHEVQNYLTVTKHNYQTQNFIANKEWFESLDPEHQQIITEAAAETISIQRDLQSGFNEDYLEEVSEYLEFNELSENQIEEFRKLSEPLYEKFADTPSREELIEKILELTK